MSGTVTADFLGCITSEQPIWGTTLPHLVTPYPDEWLLGLLLRCDLANGWFAGTTARLIAIAPLAESPRVTPGFFITATLFDLQRLASLLVVSVDDVENTAFTHALSRFKPMHKPARTLGAITGLRVCPACVAERHLILKSVVLTGLSTCAVHQVVLQSSCLCGRALFAWSRRTRPFTCGACAVPWELLPRQLDPQAHRAQTIIRQHYDALLFSSAYNTYSRARLLIREVVERRVAAGERLSTSAEVRLGRVLAHAEVSVATLALGLARMGVPPGELATGFVDELSAEKTQHQRIKFGFAADWFWSRVARSDDDACWLWRGPTDDDGFGYIHMRRWGIRSRMFAHRFAYMVAVGEIPTNYVVNRVCGTQLCARPDHLRTRWRRPGTCPLERRARGDANGSRRHPERRHRGESSPSARLTAAQVLSIRRQHAAGTMTYNQLADKHGVHEDTIARAVRGETWRHLPGFSGRTKTARRRAALAPYAIVHNPPQKAF